MPNFTGVSAIPRFMIGERGVEGRDLGPTGAVVRRALQVAQDGVKSVGLLHLHAVGRHVPPGRVKVGEAHVEGIAAGRPGDPVQDVLDDEHALRAAETAKGGVGDGVGLEPARTDAGGGEEVGVVGVEHRPVDDALRQVRGVAAAGEVLDGVALDAARLVEADAPVGAKVVALAGEDEIVVAVEADLAGAAGDAGGERGERRPLGRLAFLASEPAAHAAHLAGDVGIGQPEHAGDHVLHLRRVLGGREDVHRPVLVGGRESDLAFEVEVLLAADAERPFEPVRTSGDRRLSVPAAEGIVGEDGLVPFERVLDGDARRLARDLHRGELDGAPGRVAGLGHDGEEGLAMEADDVGGEQGVVAEGGGNVVDPGNVGGGEHGDDARGGSDCCEVERDEPSPRPRRLADCNVERAVRLAEIVDVERGALDVLGGGVVGERAMDVAEGLRPRRHRGGALRGPLSRRRGGWGERTPLLRLTPTGAAAAFRAGWERYAPSPHPSPSGRGGRAALVPSVIALTRPPAASAAPRRGGSRPCRPKQPP